MRLRLLFGMSAVCVLAALISPAGYGQFQFKMGGAPGGGQPGGSPFGGGQFGRPQVGGGPQGPGGYSNGSSRSGYMSDPSKVFDFMARGQPVLVIAEMQFKGLQGPLTQFAQEKGITNGQITREQFVQFSEAMKAKMASGATNTGDAPQAGGAPGSGSAPATASLETLQQWADADFKTHDENGDGKLNPDEMPGSLKRDLARWDSNKDGFVDQTEYRAYYISRRGSRTGAAPD